MLGLLRHGRINGGMLSSRISLEEGVLAVLARVAS